MVRAKSFSAKHNDTELSAKLFTYKCREAAREKQQLVIPKKE